MIDEDLREKVLAEISPTQEEIRHQNRVISVLKRALSDIAKQIDQSYVSIEPQGSTGVKQTQLRGDADIDLFVGLNPSDYADIIEEQPRERKKMLWEVFNRLVDSWFIPAVKTVSASDIKKTYSAHPYLSCVLKGLDIDIVSYFHLTRDELVSKGPITAVDRTVHHSIYVVKHLTERKRENVRILKSFVKACYTYGDTSAIGKNGFTGYALELISIDSESLDDAFTRLFHLEQMPIDPKGRYLEELKDIPAFRDDFVFVIDPTDLNRNVTSSLDPRSYNWTKMMIERLEKYLRDGQEEDALDLLLEKPIPAVPPPSKIKHHLRAFEFHSDGSYHYTVVRDKLYHFARKMAGELMREPTGEPRFGQILFELYFENNIFSLGVYVERPEIPENYERRGPALSLKQAVRQFKLRNPDNFERDGYIWAVKKRRWTSAWDMIEHMRSKSRIKGVTNVEHTGVVSTRALFVLSNCIVPMELHEEHSERD